ncbi:MAG: flavodoxin [Marinilabiliales bacterium]
MKKIAVIYWPKGGATEKCARMIYDKLASDSCDIYNLKEVNPEILPDYDLLIIGGSTVGADNWQDAYKGDLWGPFHSKMKDNNITLEKTKVAFFGLGDQILYPDDFVNDMKILYDYFTDLKGVPIGKWSQESYDHTDSNSIIDDQFLGLALDEHNQPELTGERIDKWIKQIFKEL